MAERFDGFRCCGRCHNGYFKWIACNFILIKMVFANYKYMLKTRKPTNPKTSRTIEMRLSMKKTTPTPDNHPPLPSINGQTSNLNTNTSMKNL